tara:strand:- start:509 stop:667 length:159 start_codon:yes stop_codon:yes gene_type:complete
MSLNALALKERNIVLFGTPLQSDFLFVLPQRRGDREGKCKGLNSFLKKNSLR